MITIYIPGLPLKSYEYRRGDAQVIHDDKKNAIIIDGGEPDLSNKIIAYCKNNGITHVTLICTHWHYDHDIGILAILNVAGIFVDKLICPPPSELAGLGDPDATEDRARGNRRIARAQQLSKPIMYPEAGKTTTIQVGDIKCNIWRRKANKNDFNDYEVNNTSIQTYFPDLYYLTGGDMINSEYYLATKPGTVKVFKIWHHGNACSDSNCKTLKAMGASLCWYNNWEKSGVGIGASNFSKYGAGNTKRYFTTLRTDSDIVMTAQNGVLTVQKGASKWTYTVPYKGEATSGWKHGESGWWYQYEDGTYAVGWKELPWSGGKDWFYFNKNGIMLTGWYYDEGLKAWYYLDPETGRMLKNGPIHVDGYWYYLDGYGRMRTGWYDPGDGYRYLEEDPTKNLGHMYVSTEATIEIHATKKFVFDGYGIAKEVTE